MDACLEYGGELGLELLSLALAFRALYVDGHLIR
jgi:hypothetical protein